MEDSFVLLLLRLSLVFVAAKAGGFFLMPVLWGVVFSKRLYRWAARLQTKGIFLTVSLVICFFMSYLPYQAGLAAVIRMVFITTAMTPPLLMHRLSPRPPVSR